MDVRKFYPGLVLAAVLLCSHAEAAKVVVEGEQYLSIVPSMSLQNDGQASGGKTVEVPLQRPHGTIEGGPSDAGHALYVINVPETGRYQMWARCWWCDDTGNSFSVLFDTESVTSAAPCLTDQTMRRWHWVAGPVVQMMAGAHVVRIQNREDGAKLDQWLLTSDSREEWQPTRIEQATPEYVVAMALVADQLQQAATVIAEVQNVVGQGQHPAGGPAQLGVVFREAERAARGHIAPPRLRDERGPERARALACADYSSRGCPEIAGWDWLRAHGASARWEFNGHELVGSERGKVYLNFSGLCTNGMSGGAGYETTLKCKVSAGTHDATCNLRAENPFRPRHEANSQGVGYSVYGSTLISQAVVDEAVRTGRLRVELRWDDGVGRDYHVAVKQGSMSIGYIR